MKKFLFFSVLLLILPGCESISNKEFIPENGELHRQISTEYKLSNSDKSIINGATTLDDPHYCNNLDNEELKSICLQEVTKAREMVMLENFECESITTMDLKRACLINIDINERLKEKDKVNEEKLKNEYTTRDAAFQAMDVNMCRELTVNGVKNECLLNIVLKKSIEEKNPSLCTELDSKEFIEICSSTATSVIANSR